MSVPPAGARGPRRQRQLPDERIVELLARARAAGIAYDNHRDAMLTEADIRRAAIAELYAAGLSIRQIASSLGAGVTTVADAVREHAKRPSES